MFRIVLDEVIVRQLRRVKDTPLRMMLSKALDDIEARGPAAGKLLDPRLRLYEVKAHRPPLRIYFRHVGEEIHVFEFEMKKSAEQQRKTISKIRGRDRSS